MRIISLVFLLTLIPFLAMAGTSYVLLVFTCSWAQLCAWVVVIIRGGGLVLAIAVRVVGGVGVVSPEAWPKVNFACVCNR